jgi:hypothetical protein
LRYVSLWTHTTLKWINAPPVMMNFHSLLKAMEKKFSQLIYFLVCCYRSEKNNQNYEFSIKCIHSILLSTTYILWNLYATRISGRFPETLLICFLWYKIITAVILRLKSWPVLHKSWVSGHHGAWILCGGTYYVCGQYETCFMSPFWHLQFLENLYTPELEGRLLVSPRQKKWRLNVPPEWD